MESDEFARLEKLVDRLLSERDELLRSNVSLTGERDRLLDKQERVTGELDRLLAKLDRLDRGSA